MNSEALETSFTYTTLHGFPLMDFWVYACQAKADTPREMIAYDLRCEACLLVALAHLAQGHDPYSDIVEDRSVSRYAVPLSRSVSVAIRKYGWDV